MLAKYVKSLGEYLQNIHIVCPAPNLLTARGVAAYVSVLLVGLTSLKEGKRTIREFRLSQLYFRDSWSHFRFSMCYLVDSIATFLQTQTNLRHFDMTDACMGPPYSYQIIKALAMSKSVRRLRVLHLVNYFDGKVSTNSIGFQLKVLIGKCCYVKELSLNYSYLFSVGVIEMCESLSQTLDQLTIFATVLDFSESNLDVINSEQWRRARAACSSLQIRFDIEGWPVNPTTILVPQIPIVHLSIKGGQCPRSTFSLGGKASILLLHLALCFDSTLQSAYLYVDGDGIPSLSNDSLIYFLMKCKKLIRVTLSNNLVPVDYNISKVKDALSNGKLKSLIVSQSFHTYC